MKHPILKRPVTPEDITNALRVEAMLGGCEEYREASSYALGAAAWYVSQLLNGDATARRMLKKLLANPLG